LSLSPKIFINRSKPYSPKMDFLPTNMVANDGLAKIRMQKFYCDKIDKSCLENIKTTHWKYININLKLFDILQDLDPSGGFTEAFCGSDLSVFDSPTLKNHYGAQPRTFLGRTEANTPPTLNIILFYVNNNPKKPSAKLAGGSAKVAGGFEPTCEPTSKVWNPGGRLSRWIYSLELIHLLIIQ